MVRDPDPILNKAGILQDDNPSPSLTLLHKAVILMAAASPIREFVSTKSDIILCSKSHIFFKLFILIKPQNLYHFNTQNSPNPKPKMQFFKFTFLLSLVATVVAQDCVCCRRTDVAPRYAMLRPRDALDCCMPQDGCTPCEGC